MNGPGVGYGLSSIALFDLVYCVPEAYFFAPFVKWGLSAEACSSFTLPRVLGRQRASRLLLAGERVSAEELQRCGLISRIVHPNELMSEVMRAAEDLAGLPSESLTYNKRLLMEPLREELLRANERELTTLRERVRSQEAKTAIRAFKAGQNQSDGVRSKL